MLKYNALMKVRSKLLAALAAAGLTCSPAAGADVTGHHALSNGLDVRLYPRQSTPLVATLVLVKTGYALEGPTNLGYSHLLEHLIFAGTEEMNKEELFHRVEEMGGYLNGYTRDDYMGYLMVGHWDHFERQMELLSDILFRAAMKEEAVGEAREVVLEEIRRRESRPDTRMNEIFQSLLYEGSTYARTGLGNESTVSSVSRAELLDHYRAVYRPDNMILLAAGGLDAEVSLAVLEKTFGAVGPGALPEEPPPPPPLKGRRVYTLETELPDLHLKIGFNGPDPREEDAEALELLAAILGGGGGRLKKALEAAGFSPRSAGAGLSVKDGFSRFTVSADLPAGTDAEGALGAILGEIGAVAQAGPSAEEVVEARDALKAGEIMGREKLHYYLMGKAPWVLAGSPGQGLSEKRWDGFFTADQRLAAEKYLAGRPYAALVALPAEKEEEAGEGRDLRPGQALLENGLVIIAEERPGSQVFALNLLTRQRSALEPAGKAGIADFLHRMLPRGTEGRSKEQIEEDLRRAGVSLSTAGNPTVPFGDFYTSRTYSFVRAECLLDKAEQMIKIIADMVGAASFPEEEVEKVRGQMEDYIAFRDARPGALADRLLAAQIYGPGPLGSDVLGGEEAIASLTRSDLVSFREKYFTGRNLVLSVVSGLPPEEAAGLLVNHFEGLPPGEEVIAVPLQKTGEVPPLEKELGKAQGALAAGAVVGPVPAGRRTALAVVAGLLNDRLNRELREKEGLAYSLGASLGTVGETAVFTFSMGTSPEKIEQARAGLRREIEAQRAAAVTAEELERRVNAITGRLQMRMLSSLNRGFYLALAEAKDLPHTFGEDYRQLLLALTPEQVEDGARSFLPERLTEVIVR
jgi:zinc protease